MNVPEIPVNEKVISLGNTHDGGVNLIIPIVIGLGLFIFIMIRDDKVKV